MHAIGICELYQVREAAEANLQLNGTCFSTPAYQGVKYHPT